MAPARSHPLGGETKGETQITPLSWVELEASRNKQDAI